MKMRSTVLFLVLVVAIISFLTGISYAEGKIVYSNSETNWKIWVMDTDGNNEYQLTFGPGRDAFPIWSPDGKMIAFHSNRETDGSYYEVFIMDADGSNIRKIASMPGANLVAASWYYDGTKLGGTANMGSNNNSIYWFFVDGTPPQPLYDAHTKIDFHSFSPDGERMLFCEWGNLTVMNIDGSNKRVIASAQRAEWMPHPELILYVKLGGARNIYTINPDTLEQNQLTFDAPSQEHYLSPLWSMPVASKIVYNKVGNLWMMDPDGENKIQLTYNGRPGEGSGELYWFPDNHEPVAICKDIEISAGEDCLVTLVADQVDNGSYDPDENDEINLSIDDHGPFSPGIYFVTLTVTDSHNESDTCQAKVTVLDTLPPVPDDVNLPDIIGQCTAKITTIPTATDNCSGQIHGVTADPLVYNQQGEYTVTWIYDDGNGNLAYQGQTIIVKDTTVPVITDLTASPDVLWPPNHKMVQVTVSAAVADNCDSNPMAKIVSIISNEPENGTGDGDTPSDWEITGDLTVNLRAERSGIGDGRLYTITVQCIDACGNSSIQDVIVTVPHDKK